MWFLQTGSLFIIFCTSLIMCALIKLFYRKPYFDLVFKYGLLLTGAAGIFLIDKRVFAFYAVYTGVIFLMLCLLNRVRSKAIFFISVLVCFLPLVAIRFMIIRLGIDYAWIAVGLAFNMLKAADAAFFVYYTGMKIDFTTFANFIFFLPTFTAGPIMRFRDFSNAKPVPLSAEDAEYCVKRIIRGGFKKLVVTFFILQVFNVLLELDGAAAFLGLTAASYFLLFFDLSGYSDIAVAFGRVFGITVAENFKNPFKAPSFSLFWRNWHVTLSDWIREHIFIVFSGVKLSKLQTAAIAFCTMVFMSLWHGFNAWYLAAGVYNGLFLALENLFSLTSYGRKSNRVVFFVRCLAVNFLFAVNTLVFTVPHDRLAEMIGFFS